MTGCLRIVWYLLGSILVILGALMALSNLDGYASGIGLLMLIAGLFILWALLRHARYGPRL